MKNTSRWSWSLVVAALVLLAVGTARAEVKWRFPVGLAYGSGMLNILDTIEEQNFDLDDKFMIPVGLTLSPYAEFDFGLGLGITVGPTAFTAIRVEYYGYDYWEEDYFSYIIPVGFDVRYAILRDKSVSPYVRAGFRYNIAGGDFIGDSTPGFYGGIGVEFFRNKRVTLGVEVGYDSTEVEIESVTQPWLAPQTIKPYEFMVSVFATF